MKWVNRLLHRGMPSKNKLPEIARSHENFSEEWMAQGLKHYQQRQWTQAATHFRRILEIEPSHPDALYRLGETARQQGNNQEAAEFIGKAIELNSNVANFHYSLGCALQELNRVEEAAESYMRAILFDPGHAKAHNNLGCVRHIQGRLDEAAKSYRQALNLNPDLEEASFNLGMILKEQRKLDEAVAWLRQAVAGGSDRAQWLRCLADVVKEQGECREAIELYERAVEIDAGAADILFNLAVAYGESGMLDKAIACYQRVLRLAPEHFNAYLNLGSAVLKRGDARQALDLFNDAIRLQPTVATGHNNAANAYMAQGKFDEGIASYKKAIELDPQCVDAYTNLGNALQKTGRIEEAETCHRRALALKPDFAGAHSNLLLCLHYRHGNDPHLIHRAHSAWAEQHAHPFYPERSPQTGNGRTEQRLRIGYISPDFRCHSVAYFIEPILAAHNRDRYRLYCYSDVMNTDEVTQRICSLADEWRDISGLPDGDVMDLIRRDRIDILVDLAGHTGNNRMLLFARKPAPVQVSYLGYPGTTGLHTMDYRLTDDIADPEGVADQFYVERLIRLPGGFLCYRPFQSPPVAALPCLANEFVTFGSFNNFAKVTPQVLMLWTRLLAAVPGARLLLKAGGLASEATRRELMGYFLANGVAAGRVDLRNPDQSITQHLERYNEVDIGLDTFPYNGTTTTCEALWMGVPVITLAGGTHVSRVGASILKRAGLDDLIAQSADSYIEKAAALASDIGRLKTLRGDLRARMESSPLCDAAGFTRELEAVYERMWRLRRVT